MEPSKGDITQLLQQYQHGDRDAEGELFKRVYSELHRLAAYYLRGERSGHMLQPTALVNEAYLRLAAQREKEWQNRAHFIAVSARIMRQVLVDFARHARAESATSAFRVSRSTRSTSSIPRITTRSSGSTWMRH